MKKILALSGGSKNHSKTNLIIKNWFEQYAKTTTEIETEIVSLAETTLKLCTGCRMCYRTGACELSDDMSALLTKMDEASVIVFASPVYMNNVTGAMKNFIDRLSVHSHLMSYSGKLGFVLATSESSGHEYTKAYLSSIQTYLGIKNIGSFHFTSEMGKINEFTNQTAAVFISNIENNYGYTNVKLENAYRTYKQLYTKNDNDVYEPFVYQHWKNDKVQHCKRHHEYTLLNRNKNQIFSVPKSKLEYSCNAQVIEFINEIYETVWNQFNNETLDSIYFSNVLLFLTELYDLVEDQSEIEVFGYTLCKQIKYKIENEGVSEEDIVMSVGFGLACFAVSEYSKKTGHLQKFSNLMNQELLNKSAVLAKRYLEGQNDTTVFQYDIMAGLAGALYYLLDFEWSESNNDKLMVIINFLISLSDDYSYNGRDVIRFHIKHENQYNEELKEKCKDGHINFGLSHGVLGPLIALSKAHFKGISSDCLTSAVDKLFRLYLDFELEYENILYWPGQLPYEDYILNNVSYDNIHKSASWCYGNVSIVKGLEKVSHYMNWEHYKEKYEHALFNILNQEPMNYKLVSPSLCHGITSVLMVGLGNDVLNSKMEMSQKDKLAKLILNICEENNNKISENPNILLDEELHIEGYALDFSLFEGVLGIGISLLGYLKGSTESSRLLLVD